MTTFNLALHSLEQAAKHHQRAADQLVALRNMLKTIDAPKDNTMPVEAMAQVLLPLDLCIVHKEVISQARHIVYQTDDVDGLSRDDLALLFNRLDAALAGRAA